MWIGYAFSQIGLYMGLAKWFLTTINDLIWT
jgi:hypothetical protein